MSKMGSHCSFGHLKHKLRPKEKPRVKTGSQIANLTPDQKKSGIDLIYLVAGDVPHIVGKLLMRATTLLQTASRSEVWLQSYAASKSRKSWLAQFRDSHAGVRRESRESRDKKAISMWAPWNGAEYIIGSKVVAYSRGPGCGVSCGPKCPWLVPTPKGVPECELTTLWFVLDANSRLIY
jgi:hypothetical protein